MHYQKSFNQNISKQQPSLYIVATPIGNLQEITKRMIDVLSKVNVIYCEDTRHTKKLLSFLNIKKQLISYHNFNANYNTDQIINNMLNLEEIALVSDAGCPLICDPGYQLVNAAITNNIKIIPVGINNAFIAALMCSGFNLDQFSFWGFVPKKEKDFVKLITKINQDRGVFGFYQSPHQLVKTLQIMLSNLNTNCQIFIAKEITKLNEQFWWGNIDELYNFFQSQEKIKGEFVIIIENKKLNHSSKLVINNQHLCWVQALINHNVKTKDAIAIIAEQHNINKNDLYHLFHKKGILKNEKK